MVHVLRQIHKSLRTKGLLLDIHPLPEDPQVEVVGPKRARSVGALQRHEDSRDIRAARRRFALVAAEGAYGLERRRIFHSRSYHESVASWHEYRDQHGATSVIPPAVLRAVEREMRSPQTKLVVDQRVRASIYRRLD